LYFLFKLYFSGDARLTLSQKQQEVIVQDIADSRTFESWAGRVRTAKEERTYKPNNKHSSGKYLATIYYFEVPIEIMNYLRLKNGDLMQIAARRIKSRSQLCSSMTPPRRDPSALNIGRKRSRSAVSRLRAENADAHSDVSRLRAGNAGGERGRPRLGNRESTKNRSQTI
jgi:hypothetical protein